jgi:hypothetical protein
MGSQRAADLADTFEKTLGDLTKTVEQCTEEQWQAECGDEKWSVATTAHHVGSQWPLEREYLDAISSGSPMPQHTWDDVNKRNEKHAQEFANVSKDEVISLLRKEGPERASWVRGLSDEQLDRTAPMPLADNAVVTTQQLIEGGILIGHAAEHSGGRVARAT